ncbi:MAG: hypothetical protein LH660_11675 [Phormidesmis sp. CAN_BIN36]|nr:hypothetical protein [Phormidesmis sp. CAN_BIN36]
MPPNPRHCDNCKSGIAASGDGLKPYPIHSQVIHKSWGEGTVMRYEANKVVILFEQVINLCRGMNLRRGMALPCPLPRQITNPI